MIILILAAHLCLALATRRNPAMQAAMAAHCSDGTCSITSNFYSEADVNTMVTGNGFHRFVEYSIRFRCPSSGNDILPECTAALLQPLPTVLYANIYELENAASVGKGPRVRLFGQVDVESIAKYSEPTVLAIYDKVESVTGKTAREQHEGSSYCAGINATTPVHGRYPRARAPTIENTWFEWILSPVVEVKQDVPLLLLDCSGNGEWHRVQTKQHPPDITWSLPAGNIAHAAVSAILTAAVVATAAGFVLREALTPGVGC